MSLFQSYHLKLQRRRSGISPIVATIFLIVVVLISSVILGTFVFGLMGSYIPPPEVIAGDLTCSVNGNVTSCQMTLTNEGGHSTATTGSCALSSNTGQDSVVGGGTIPAGSSLNGVACVSHHATVAMGSQIQGSLSLTDGEIVIFFGTLN
jgi:hypothetical protein